MVASWVVCSTPERAVRVQALPADIVLCSWARHFTLTVPLSTQLYKWVPANCWGKPNKLRGSCHVLTRLNEPHQSNMAVHSKHVLLKICTRIHTYAGIQFTYFHIWQMPQGAHNTTDVIVESQLLYFYLIPM